MSVKPASQYTTKVSNSAQCIDLRSDTVTLPSAEMKKAIVEAVLGDDVYGEDETVNQLESRCAELFCKESAIFVASGTMGNLLAIMAHCQRGDEIIVGRHNHIHRVSATTIDVGSDGTMKIQDIEEAIRVADNHMPITRLICLESTHNFSGGRVLPLEYLKSVNELASRHNLSVHLDGARIYNAAVALNVKVSDIAQYADSVMMCFSKGLGAPVGSILALGGGWRQAGILAAAAHVALDHAEETIRRDHANAKKLALGLNERTPSNLKNRISACENEITNMVLLECNSGISPTQVQQFFHSHGVLVMAFDSKRIRIVLNWGVTEADVDRALNVYSAFVDSISIS
ncbi:unnamed protein product [Nippostrongylus brasiliensis]|uniref:Beta_elim_lyase domain-containing protein n=1 Tax=Nippostrongylus brasiliensis TaxID=27835 RepID=A0A0N4YJ11_NIPBR|nr:unnamed protein product [Nippostrongylus brasiliensis]